MVVEWTRQIGGMKIGDGPRRPRHFTAGEPADPPAADHRVLQRAQAVRSQWVERGHTFGAYVLLGRKAPAALAARARGVLDTLRVAAR